MFMLQAYLDDSGSDAGSPEFVLGGFLANVGQWRRFAPIWKRKLAAEPRVGYLKMSEAMFLDGEFLGVPSAVRDQKVFELAEIARAHVEARVACSLRRADFDAIIRPIVPPGSPYADPYFVLFYVAVLDINAFQMRLGLPTEIDFIFDEQGTVGHVISAWWPELKRMMSDARRAEPLGSPPIFRDEKRFLQLQAADLYAWTLRDRLARQGEARGPEPVANGIWQLLNDRFPIGRRLDAEYLTGLAASICAAVGP